MFRRRGCTPGWKPYQLTAQQWAAVVCRYAETIKLPLSVVKGDGPR